jgi:hypothetical protein
LLANWQIDVAAHNLQLVCRRIMAGMRLIMILLAPHVQQGDHIFKEQVLIAALECSSSSGNAAFG